MQILNKKLSKFSGTLTFCCLAMVAVLSGTQGATAQTNAPQKHVSIAGIPSGLVAPHGLAFVGLSGTSKRSSVSSDQDASAVIGIGFGDANKNVGFQLTTHITSLSNDFGDSGYFSLKASRRIASGKNPTYASLSFGHLGNWGDSKGSDVTGTIAVTTFTRLSLGNAGESYPLMLTLGAGSHMRNNLQDPGVFFGIGMGFTPQFGGSIAWTGDAVSIGTGFKIKGLKNATFNLSLDDAFNQNDRRRVTFSLGFQIRNVFGG